VTVSVFFVEQ